MLLLMSLSSPLSLLLFCCVAWSIDQSIKFLPGCLIVWELYTSVDVVVIVVVVVVFVLVAWPIGQVPLRGFLNRLKSI